MDEYRLALENKDRHISRLLKDKANLEKEIYDIKLKLNRLNKQLKSKTVRLQISILPNSDEEPEIINVE